MKLNFKVYRVGIPKWYLCAYVCVHIDLVESSSNAEARTASIDDVEEILEQGSMS